MSNDDRRRLGMINCVPVVELRPEDHAFAGFVDGDRPGESRLRCMCGWTSVSAPSEFLDIDVHYAELNGITYEEQKKRTARVMRQLGSAWPDPKPSN